MKLEKSICFFDLETTGVDTDKDQIVEISIIKITPSGEQLEFYSLIDPQIEIPKSASDVHGITFETVLNAPTLFGLAPEIYSFIKGCDFGGFNSDRFDVPMLFNKLSNLGYVIDWDYNLLDVLKFERHLVPNKLAYVYKRRTGKDLENAHSAKADVLATIDIFKAQNKDLGLSVAEIDKMLQGDKKRVDINGKLYADSNGVVRWTFGKNIDKDIFQDINYLNWVMSSDFPEETKNIIVKLSKQRQNTN